MVYGATTEGLIFGSTLYTCRTKYDYQAASKDA